LSPEFVEAIISECGEERTRVEHPTMLRTIRCSGFTLKC